MGESFQLLNHCVWRSLVRPQQLNQLEYFISKGLFIGLCCTTTLSPLSYLVLSSCEINARLCRAGMLLECFHKELEESTNPDLLTHSTSCRVGFVQFFLMLKGLEKRNFKWPWLQAKMAMPDSQRYHWNLSMIKNVEETVGFDSKSVYLWKIK